MNSDINPDKDNFFHSSRELWNRRAKSWEFKQKNGDSDHTRLEHTLCYLREKALINSDSVVADIGSGPCNFGIEFAKTAKHVSCFDISDKMLEIGKRNAKEQKINNIDFYCCDFSKLNLNESISLYGIDLHEKYSLVFSSLTPAVGNRDSLFKMMEMSKAYCMNISHIYRYNSLTEALRTELFKGLSIRKSFDQNFLNMFNILFEFGFNPIVDYDYRHEIKSFIPDSYYAETLMEQLLPQNLHNNTRVKEIKDWLDVHKDKDGRLTQELNSCYGRILWDKRRMHK